MIAYLLIIAILAIGIWSLVRLVLRDKSFSSAEQSHKEKDLSGETTRIIGPEEARRRGLLPDQAPPALLNAIEIPAPATVARIELRRGDLTDLPEEEAVDVLVVSSFRDGYGPTEFSLIGALQRKGISVAELAANKYVDLRDAFSCWLSRELPRGIPGIQFRRLLCFETDPRGISASAAVRDIFRALAPFVAGDPHIQSIAMPLLATGDQGYSVKEILPPLLESAIEWLKIGMPLHTVRIYGRVSAKLSEAEEIFSTCKAALTSLESVPHSSPHWDAFISYAHEDSSAALSVAEQLKPCGFKIFVDQLELEHGAAWQQKIFDVLDDTRIVVPIYSPDYVMSKVCLEEFNIAWTRNRSCGGKLIFPIYWRSCRLPTYMQTLNFADCRETEGAKLEHFCGVLQQRLKH